MLGSNFIVSPNFESKFSRHLDNTFRTAFPYISRHVIDEDYKMYNSDGGVIANVIYLYTKQPEDRTDKVYTDDKNTIFYDKPQTR